MPLDTFTKDPDAILDYQWDWADWLGADTITAATVTAPTGITLDTSTNTTTTVTAWLSGGTTDADYSVACLVETAGGRTDERTIKIQVRER